MGYRAHYLSGVNRPTIRHWLDALRFHELRGDVCPANWNEGEDGIEESQDGIVDYLSKYATKD